MKIHLLSYSTPEYSMSQRLLNCSARLRFSCNLISKRSKDLEKTEFYQLYKNILTQKRGGGYWLWKPYYILETLHSIEEGDILIYSDCAIVFRKNPIALLERVKLNGGFGLFCNAGKMSDYTKRDLFVTLDADEEKYYNAPQIHAGLQIYVKNKTTVKFIEEVLKTSTTGELITDAENTLGKSNLPGFTEHRHDQSIISLIAHKQGIYILPDTTQFRVYDKGFHIDKGYTEDSEASLRSVFYVHRYSNRKLWKLIPDFINFLLK